MEMFEIKSMLVWEKSLSGVSGWISRDRMVMTDSFWAFLVFSFFKLLLFLLIFMIIVLSFPFWISVVGLLFKRQYRHGFGIASLFSLALVAIDLNNNWASGVLGYGWASEDGSMNEALFSPGFVENLLFMTNMGVGLAIGFMLDYFMNEIFREKLDAAYARNDLAKWVLIIGIYLTPVFAAVHLIHFKH